MRSGGKPVTQGRRRSVGGRRGGLAVHRRAALLLLAAPLFLLATSLLFGRKSGGTAPYRRLTGSRRAQPAAPYVGPVKEDAFGMLADISYLGVKEVDHRLGCPTSTHGCFYSFSDDEGKSTSAPHELVDTDSPLEWPQ